jgi:DNA polymerase-3 subunit epsilon
MDVDRTTTAGGLMGVFHRSKAEEAQRGGAERFVVVDVETTGVYNSDRVVEIGAVTLSPRGEVVDEWDTLINPERDVGPTYIHGITASMVSVAPRFEHAAVALADRLQGAVLVAHNLPFDSRMLVNEYSRLGAKLDPGKGVCTLSHCGGRLEVACAQYGIDIGHHHRALADARATAQLFLAARCDCHDSAAAALAGLPDTAFSRTLRREVVTKELPEIPFLARLASLTFHRQARGASLVYLDLLDRALGDLSISADEWAQLFSVADSLGMSSEDMHSSHEYYLRELIGAAVSDGRITDAEYGLLDKATRALRLDERSLKESISRYRVLGGCVRIEPDTCVCFTGAAAYADGTELGRAELGQIARSLGMRLVDSVTKKGCDVLVAADPSSQSGKAKKARQFGIPVVSVEDFLCARVGGEMPAC